MKNNDIKSNREIPLISSEVDLSQFACSNFDFNPELMKNVKIEIILRKKSQNAKTELGISPKQKHVTNNCASNIYRKIIMLNRKRAKSTGLNKKNCQALQIIGTTTTKNNFFIPTRPKLLIPPKIYKPKEQYKTPKKLISFMRTRKYIHSNEKSAKNSQNSSFKYPVNENYFPKTATGERRVRFLLNGKTKPLISNEDRKHSPINSAFTTIGRNYVRSNKTMYGSFTKNNENLFKIYNSYNAEKLRFNKKQNSAQLSIDHDLKPKLEFNFAEPKNHRQNTFIEPAQCLISASQEKQNENKRRSVFSRGIIRPSTSLITSARQENNIIISSEYFVK